MKTLCAVLLLTSSVVAIAAPASLQQCRGIADATARLACYDALPIAESASSTRAAEPSPTTAAIATTTAVRPPIIPPAISAPEAKTVVDQFGLENRPAKNVENSIASQVDSSFDGWGSNSRIKLANGQVWQVSDDSSRDVRLKSTNVIVRRGALGAFYMEFDGTNYSPRVKRVQ